MKILSTLSIFVFLFSFAEAKTEISEDGSCITSTLLQKTYLSCIACGLAKAGRPAPDENYLTMLGMLTREKVDLFPNEKKNEKNKAFRWGLGTGHANTIGSPSAPVEFTVQAQYQSSVLQNLLAAGYCTEGKIKSRRANNDYSNTVERIRSDIYIVPPKSGSPGIERDLYKQAMKNRDEASKELGFSSWEDATEELFVNDPTFYKMTFAQQKKIFDERRTKALKRDSNSFVSESEIKDCLQDIQTNYSTTLANDQESYKTCRAIYDECGIATVPRDSGTEAGSIYRTVKADGKDVKVRVGGDWCNSKYPKAVPEEVKSSPAPDAAPSPYSLSNRKVNFGDSGKTAATPAAANTAPKTLPAANTYDPPQKKTVYVTPDGKVYIEGQLATETPDGYVIPKTVIAPNNTPAQANPEVNATK